MLGGLAVLLGACSVKLAPLVPSEESGGSAGQAGGGSGGVEAGSGGEAGSAGSGAADAASGGSSDAAADSTLSPGPLLGQFSFDYYWITTEEEFPGTKSTNLYDASCQLLATVTPAFAASVSAIGTGRLFDGRILNSDGACACPTSPCFFESDATHPWGYGVQNIPLSPFRSLAVDKNEIAYGSHVYVPALDGVTIPGNPPWGGFVHDGCLSADDTGGTSTGKNAAWFVALKAYFQTLNASLVLTSVDVYQGGAHCP